MFAESEWADYVEEIRRGACAHCLERPALGPPCAPLGKRCGVEMHLGKLVECIRGVQGGPFEIYQEAIHHDVCARCAMRGCEGCPCPMDFRGALVVRAVEDGDERREQWARLHRLCRPAGRQRVPVAELYRSYEERTDTSVGCD